jgi:hypothetical protein
MGSDQLSECDWLNLNCSDWLRLKYLLQEYNLKLQFVYIAKLGFNRRAQNMEAALGQIQFDNMSYKVYKHILGFF